MGDYKVIHPDSRADLGSSHHFMHNGEEINLVSAKVDEKSMCEVKRLCVNTHTVARRRTDADLRDPCVTQQHEPPQGYGAVT